MSLKVQIVADSKFPVDRKRLRRALADAWEKYGIETDVNLSIAVVGTRKMAYLNQTYLLRKGPTDVLAFPQQSSEGSEYGFILPGRLTLELGDIVICFPLALDQASRLGVLLDEQIVQLALYGLSNIMGNHDLERPLV